MGKKENSMKIKDLINEKYDNIKYNIVVEIEKILKLHSNEFKNLINEDPKIISDTGIVILKFNNNIKKSKNELIDILYLMIQPIADKYDIEIKSSINIKFIGRKIYIIVKEII